ncbi:hypothetical protein ACUSIJ_23565 [Pseudochelatococcus sp. B33]
MRNQAFISGCSTTVARPFPDTLDATIRRTVLCALEQSGLVLEEIDSVVTVAGDTLDGISVPGRAELAGGYGRRFLNLPSSAGHGLAAAVTQIEAGEAENLILVGWGAATKYGSCDPRRNQADPFHARRIGASPRVVAALQAQELSAGKDEASLDDYAREMMARVWGDTPAPTGAAPVWARTGFCDGAVAIVLRRAEKGAEGVAIRDFASVSRPYSPHDERLDPAEWVGEVLRLLRHGDAGPTAGSTPILIEAAAPTPVAEQRALTALDSDADGRQINASGGGAVSYFGAATALRQLAEAYGRLAAVKEPATALVLDLAGPIGQHVTAIVLEKGARP